MFEQLTRGYIKKTTFHHRWEAKKQHRIRQGNGQFIYVKLIVSWGIENCKYLGNVCDYTGYLLQLGRSNPVRWNTKFDEKCSFSIYSLTFFHVAKLITDCPLETLKLSQSVCSNIINSSYCNSRIKVLKMIDAFNAMTLHRIYQFCGAWLNNWYFGDGNEDYWSR